MEKISTSVVLEASNDYVLEFAVVLLAGISFLLFQSMHQISFNNSTEYCSQGG